MMIYWRQIIGTMYEVSDTGIVRHAITKKERKLVYNQDGYASVGLWFFKMFKKTFRVNRLVWEAFNGPIPEGYHIDHIDHNRANNNLYNLRLLEGNINRAQGVKTGKRFNSRVAQYDIDGNLIAIYNSCGAAATEVGGMRNHIRECCKGTLKRYKGYRWEYVER